MENHQKTQNESPDQIILIDKPTGISSFGVVARVRRELRDQFGRKIKVGHTGTLDPFATGLLILLSGKMTKKSSDFLKLDKVYEATLKLGYTSTTGDPEGEITKYVDGPCALRFFREPVSLSRANPSLRSGRARDPAQPEDVPEKTKHLVPSTEQVISCLQSFLGDIQQTVPKFSAVKINGQRAYKLAREGRDFTPPTRTVAIYDLELISYRYPELTIRCHVSSGTYIRILAEDIGRRLGTGAYLTALRRTKIGNYSVQNARKLL